MAEPQQTPSGLSREELEQNVPDALHPVLQFGMDNLKAIIGVVVGILLVVGVYSGITAYAEHQAEEQANSLGRLLIQAQGPEKLKALQAFSENAPGRLKTAALLAVARTAMALKDYPAAAEAWTGLEKDAEAQDVRLVAGLGRAKCLLLEGKAEESLRALNQAAKGAPEEYGISISQMRAAAAEAAGQWAEAVNAYQKLAETQDLNERRYYLHKIEQLQARL